MVKESINLSDYPNIINGINFKIVEQDDINFNCIAHSLGIRNMSIWPAKLELWVWDKSLPYINTINNFVNLYRKFNYEICEDSSWEPDYDKIALYISILSCRNTVSHAAKQIDSYWWSSKMGGDELFEHDLEAIENKNVGTKYVFLKRPKNLSSLVPNIEFFIKNN